MSIIFGPAGLGSAKTAVKVLEEYSKKGFEACEIAFVHGAYIKPEDTKQIKEAAEKYGISFSIHAPYYVNLGSIEKEKRDKSRERILQCCEIGEMLGVRTVVFHPGYYQESKEETYKTVKKEVELMLEYIKKKKWKIEIAPEIMGKVNVFGSLDEISRLAKETGCAFCIDFAHLLARDKKVNYKEVEKAFPQKKWHVHFSGIVYGDKGEKHHKPTESKEWKELLQNLPKDKEIVIINESPNMIEDSIDGIKIYHKIN
ncbi:MAG TPA: TIM barrel protein [Candidatus Nanoarchaeia archaeon]|nr:TIM barrel protein [Candidatus Nanoarchaeia archaeon]